MKTIKREDTIKRVKDKEAMKMVKVGWSYISKSEWKEKVRVLPKKSEKKSKNKESK